MLPLAFSNINRLR